MKNILLVDDDAISNLLMSKALERIGVAKEITSAQNGKEAINLLYNYYFAAREIPDLILLDLNMPIMDGFGFIEAFNKLDILGKKNVKIVIVSSSENPDDVEKARRLGIRNFLSKPISGEQLQAVIQRI